MKKTHAIPLFIAALFTTARTWKRPRCPATDEWMEKLWYIYTMEYYSAIKRNALVYDIYLSLYDLLHCIIGSMFIHLIGTYSNAFLFMAE